MTSLLTLAVLFGGICTFVGAVWMIILAFRTHILWGLGVLFFPILGWIFAIVYLDRSWRPLLLQFGGIAIAGVAQMMLHGG